MNKLSRGKSMLSQLNSDLNRIQKERKDLKLAHGTRIIGTVTRWVNVKLALMGHDPVQDIIEVFHTIFIFCHHENNILSRNHMIGVFGRHLSCGPFR